MKVLFVCSGNSQFYNVASFIKSQGDSLEEEGIDLSYFLVEGKGAKNYIKNVGRLRKFLKEKAYDFDVIHAHYSFCGWVAVLASGRLPVVLSLMGDDAVGTFRGENKITMKSRVLKFLAWAIQPFVQAIISKSPNLESVVYRKKVSYIIPNGVKLDRFDATAGDFREELGLDPNKKYVLFLGNPADLNKNAALAEEAVKLLNRPDTELLTPFRVPHDKVAKYLNSADAFVMCSFSEGSPNVLKEAMACNCPLVATNVGDAAWVVGDTPGCYVSSHDPREFAKQLTKALDFAERVGRTKGYDRLLELGLDAPTIARRIISIYHKMLGDKLPSAAAKHEKITV